MLKKLFQLKKIHKFAAQLSDGVTGNTADFGSAESRFEPWSDNFKTNLNP